MSFRQKYPFSHLGISEDDLCKSVWSQKMIGANRRVSPEPYFDFVLVGLVFSNGTLMKLFISSLIFFGAIACAI
jgi:hypothetical protein